MSNVAIVSFKIQPDYYAVLKAMAMSQSKTLSEFVRQTVETALELDVQTRRFAAFLARAAEEVH